MTKLLDSALKILHRLEFLPALITRVAIGWVFVESGWGKLHNLEGVQQFFTSLGIPFPQYQAPFVAGTELVCGIFLIVGLLTRFASVPLIATMVVALLTAKREDIASFGDLAGSSEFLMAVGLLWLVFYGAGVASLDRLVFRRGPKISERTRPSL
jgi:putative oxidoreductase